MRRVRDIETRRLAILKDRHDAARRVFRWLLVTALGSAKQLHVLQGTAAGFVLHRLAGAPIHEAREVLDHRGGLALTALEIPNLLQRSHTAVGTTRGAGPGVLVLTDTLKRDVADGVLVVLRLLRADAPGLHQHVQHVEADRIEISQHFLDEGVLLERSLCTVDLRVVE